MSRVEAARIPVTIGLIVGVLALVASVGADAGWLAALGHAITTHGGIPDSVPFAAAPTAGWHNPLVLSELLFWFTVDIFGRHGLVALQLVAVAAGLGILAADARAAGARREPVAGVLLLTAVGALPSLALARVQLFSLVLFPALVALTRAEARRPSSRIWLALPLLALWSNLHGAVLSGLPVLYAYLAFHRARTDRRTAALVAVAAPVALCLTPAGIGTLSYFHGLLTNDAVSRGEGQWAPFGHSLFDWIALVVAITLAGRLRRVRPERWELIVLLVFAALTVKAGRDSVWLLFLLVAPSARAGKPGRPWTGLLPIGGAAAVVLLILGATGWSARGRGVVDAARRAVTLAHGSPVLADGVTAEQVALDGGRIWVGNPIDAFSHRQQDGYLDWLDGRRASATPLAQPEVHVVVAGNGSNAARLTAADPAFVTAGSVAGETFYRRR